MKKLIASAALFIFFSLAYSEEIQLQFWTLSLSPYFNETIEASIARYEEKHPNIKIQWQDLSAEDLNFELLGKIKSGDVPDVVNLNVPMLLGFAERGALLNLEFDCDYFEKALKSFQVNGQQLGLPWYLTPSLLIYNQDIFEKANLDPDAPPQTLEEVVAYAKQIKDETGIYGFMPNIANQRMLYRFLEAGLPILSEDGFEALFNAPEHSRMLDTYVELFKQDYFSQDTLLRGYVGALESYSAGQLGMLITGPQFLQRIAQNNPDIYSQTLVAPYPLDQGKVLHAPLMGLTVPKDTAYPEEALDFALFFTGASEQLSFSKAAQVFPSHPDSARDPFFSDLPKDANLEDKARILVAKQLAYAQDLTMDIPNPADLFQAVQDAVNSAILEGNPPQEVLDEAVKFWNSRL